MGAAAYACPSAQPDMVDARPIGLLSGSPTEVRIAFFKKEAIDAFDWRRTDGSEATRALRFGARCEEKRCGHFDGRSCQLGKRVSEDLELVVDHLPPCLLRPSCRWHAERGPSVCLRCPQVATMVPEASPFAAIAVTSDELYDANGRCLSARSKGWPSRAKGVDASVFAALPMGNRRRSPASAESEVQTRHVRGQPCVSARTSACPVGERAVESRPTKGTEHLPVLCTSRERKCRRALAA